MMLGIRQAADAATNAGRGWRGFTPGYQPTPRQRDLHECEAANVLYGGAAGGGKSRAMREDAFRFCHENAGVTVGLFRRTFPELRDTHVLKLRQEWPVNSYRYTKTDNTVHFGNGSALIFGHCNHEEDVARYLGTEYDRLYFDELTTFPESIYDALCARLRSTKAGLRLQVIASTNPGGVGHQWVKARWIDHSAEERIDLGGYAFIQAKLADNPHIGPEYRKQLEQLPEAKRRAYLDGDWDVFEGQYFREWRRDLHVIEPRALPERWPRVLAIDYGATAPFCALWLAADPAYPMTPHEARVYVYREHYAAGWGLDANIGRVRDLCNGDVFRGQVADPAMFAKTQERDGGRNSLADQAAQLGLRLLPANNDRLGGWGVMQALMRPREDGLPGLLVFDTCPNLIRTIPQMIHDSRRVEDLDTAAEDHAVDSCRFGLMDLLAVGRGGKAAAGAPTASVAARSAWGGEF